MPQPSSRPTALAVWAETDDPNAIFFDDADAHPLFDNGAMAEDNAINEDLDELYPLPTPTPPPATPTTTEPVCRREAIRKAQHTDPITRILYQCVLE